MLWVFGCPPLPSHTSAYFICFLYGEAEGRREARIIHVCVAIVHGMSSTWKIEGSDIEAAEQHESSGDEGAAGSVNMHVSDNPFASFAFGGGEATTVTVPASAPRLSTGDKRKKDTGE